MRAQTHHEKMGSVIARMKLFGTTLLLSLPFCATLPAHGGTAADERAGAVLFRDKGCVYCHGVGGSGGQKGPDLTKLRENNLWPTAKITQQILNGGQRMPAFRESLTAAEAAQLAAYLRARHWPIPPPAPAK